jgi:predicted HTH domain antitoxin
MKISFEIPREIEQEFRTGGLDLNQEAKEACLVGLYRQERITHHQLAEALGLSRQAKELYLKEQYRQARITHRQLQEALDLSFDETEHLLKQRGLGQDLDIAEFEAGRGLLRKTKPR